VTGPRDSAAQSDWAAQIKDRIRQRYTRLARGGTFPTGGAQRLLAAGYPAEAVDGLLPALMDAYSGCGYAVPESGLEIVSVAVELGAGAGVDTALLAQRLPPQARIIAVDLTPAMLERLRTSLPPPPEGTLVLAVAGDMEALPLPDGVADLVTANAAFTLCTDKAAAFAEAYRVLKPGGHLVARDLIREGPLPREVLEDPLSDATSLGGVVTQADMEKCLKTAGFSDIRIGDPRPFSYVVSVRLETRRAD